MYTIHFYNYYNNEFRTMYTHEKSLEATAKRAKNILNFYNRPPYKGNWATITYSPFDNTDGDAYDETERQVGFISDGNAYGYDIYGETVKLTI